MKNMVEENIGEEKTLTRMVRFYEAYINGLLRYAEMEGIDPKVGLELQNEITNARKIEARELIFQDCLLTEREKKAANRPASKIAQAMMNRHSVGGDIASIHFHG